MKYKQFLYILILISIVTFTIGIFKSWSNEEEEESIAEKCKHCHGEKLQGIQNVKSYCGDCHDSLKMRPEEMKDQDRIDAVSKGPHLHKTNNIFKGTPSCYFCHRRNDF